MEPTNHDIEKLFAQEELDLHGEYLVDLFVDAIKRKKLLDTKNLLRTFESGMPYFVKSSGSNPTLVFSFPNYGRFLEIQAGKKRRAIRTENVDTNKLLWGASTAKKKKRAKNAQWYTRNVYGAQNRLINRIMYGLSDVERKRLINLLKQK